jgi:hypothetical protein
MRLLILVAALLAGCAALYPDIEKIAATWSGSRADELMVAWGVPNAAQRLSDGRQVFSYGGSSLAGYGGMVGSYTCQTTFIADAAGKIISSRVQENAAYSCGYVLGDKPRASELQVRPLQQRRRRQGRVDHLWALGEG